MMTLWLPVLDYARSYVPVVQGITRLMDAPGCVQALGLNRGQLAAFRFHARLELEQASRESACRWLLMPQELQPTLRIAMDEKQWQVVGVVRRPADRNDNLVLYRRIG
jgi:hypothetical protein